MEPFYQKSKNPTLDEKYMYIRSWWEKKKNAIVTDGVQYKICNV